MRANPTPIYVDLVKLERQATECDKYGLGALAIFLRLLVSQTRSSTGVVLREFRPARN